jgi:hypothetical protein
MFLFLRVSSIYFGMYTGKIKLKIWIFIRILSTYIDGFMIENVVCSFFHLAVVLLFGSDQINLKQRAERIDQDRETVHSEMSSVWDGYTIQPCLTWKRTNNPIEPLERMWKPTSPIRWRSTIYTHRIFFVIPYIFIYFNERGDCLYIYHQERLSKQMEILEK